MQFLAIPSIFLLTAKFNVNYMPEDAGALWLCMLTCALGQTVNRFAKQSFSRARPTWPKPMPKRFFKLQKKISMEDGDGPSFPSGDSLGAGCVGGTLMVYFNNPIFILFPIWGSLGRQYWFFHYFFDTLFGGAIGVISAYVVKHMYNDDISSIKASHVGVIFPLFIILQKLIKRYGRWVRGGSTKKKKSK